MNYIELSIEDTKRETRKLIQTIGESFRPDVIVFISKGSYVIGKTFSDYYKVPLVEIYAEREGNAFKEFISPILKVIPKFVKKKLRAREVTSGIHNKNKQRNVYLKKGQNYIEVSNNILIVDDSVDTGHTAKQVYEHIVSLSSNKHKISFACLNCFEASENVFKVDYSLYKDHIMIGPWSKDSSYYKDFIRAYNCAKDEGDF